MVSMNGVLTATPKTVKLQGVYGEQVFCNQQGMPSRSFRTAFERSARRAGTTDFRFRDLRHTCASRLVMAGVDLSTVKDLLGQKDITMTLRYAHLSSDDTQAAVKQLAKVPAIFTTPPQSHPTSLAQVVEK